MVLWSWSWSYDAKSGVLLVQHRCMVLELQFYVYFEKKPLLLKKKFEMRQKNIYHFLH
jgi:hypothetical protein